MVARIYQPAKTAMQSGTAKTGRWCLDYEPETARGIDPLMGWTSSADMKSQIRLWFDSREAAEAYCRREGIAFRVDTPRERTRKVVSYSDNFRYGRLVPWTH